jgi:exopolysaccharide production protein ExoY
MDAARSRSSRRLSDFALAKWLKLDIRITDVTGDQTVLAEARSSSTCKASAGWEVAFSGETFKRAVDLTLAVALLVLLAPLFALITVLVWLNDGGPPFYGQVRVGVEGRRFRCWKFRSMVTDADAVLAQLLLSSDEARAEWARDHKLKRDPRVTSIGRLLRSSSLDELPQLWNVARGEMSLVGPRPIVPAEITRYGVRYRSYCACKPGLTGLWQVSGRNDVSYRRRVALDGVYARRRGLSLDMRILLLTLPAVLMRRGSY